MIFSSILLGVASIAQVSANTEKERTDRRYAASPSVRKMSDDAGEKFFMNYWQFGGDIVTANSTATSNSDQNSDIHRRAILPRSYPLKPPFAPGLERISGLHLSPLVGRDFECPTGTHGCTSIDRPDTCCRTDETCVVVEDTGSGAVGCCPAGQDCSGTIGSCYEGYTSCSSSLGGGCCIPGYECVDGGCAHIVTITITTHSTTLTTTTFETVSTVISTSTSTITATTSDTSSDTSSDSTSSTSSTSTSTDLSPPDRPTSMSTSTTSSTESSCPTGFYACAAVYQGGCCRTGRDCDTTSCPAIPSTTIVSDDRTIVIPEATTTAASSGGDGPRQCASGWFTCADTVGGGCCPSGYACGEENCTAVPTASTSGTVAKEEPAAPSNSGGRAERNWTMMRMMMMYTMIGMTWTML